MASGAKISGSNNQTASLSSTVGPVSVPPTPRVSSPSSKRNETKLRAQSLLCCTDGQNSWRPEEGERERGETFAPFFFLFPRRVFPRFCVGGEASSGGGREKWNPCFLQYLPRHVHDQGFRSGRMETIFKTLKNRASGGTANEAHHGI